MVSTLNLLLGETYHVIIHLFLFILMMPSPLPFTAAIPLNKQLYTLSYVCVTSGAAALLFSAFYIMVCFWIILEIVPFFLSWSSGLLFQLRFTPTVNVHLFHLDWFRIATAGWYLGFNILVLAFEMDWHECHACLCHGSWGNLCWIH